MAETEVKVSLLDGGSLRTEPDQLWLYWVDLEYCCWTEGLLDWGCAGLAIGKAWQVAARRETIVCSFMVTDILQEHNVNTP